MDPEKRAERYKKAVERHDEGHVQQDLENLAISAEYLHGKKSLDVGAGGGELARWARKHGADMTPLDRAPESRDLRRIAATELPFVVADARTLPFGDESFDLVVSHASIPNVMGAEVEDFVSPRIAAIREMLRVTKLGGEVRLAPVIVAERHTDVDPPDKYTARRREVLQPFIDDPALEFIEESLGGWHGWDNVSSYESARIIIRKKPRPEA